VAGGSEAELGLDELRGTRGSASRKPRWRRAGFVGARAVGAVLGRWLGWPSSDPLL